MAKTKAPLSAVAKEVLDVLRASEKPMTLQEIKEIVPSVNSSHLTAIRNRELATSEHVEKEVVTVEKRKVLSYTAVDTEDTEVTEDSE